MAYMRLIAEAVCALATWRDPAAIEGTLDRPAWPSLDRQQAEPVSRCGPAHLGCLTWPHAPGISSAWARPVVSADLAQGSITSALPQRVSGPQRPDRSSRA
jgi:hypothetical protein